MKLIPQEIVDKAAVDTFSMSFMSKYIHQDSDIGKSHEIGFKTGVEFAIDYIYPKIEFMIIENQGLKLNQDLAIEFAEWVQISDVSNRKLRYSIQEMGNNFDIRLLFKEMFDIFIKERNNEKQIL